MDELTNDLARAMREHARVTGQQHPDDIAGYHFPDFERRRDLCMTDATRLVVETRDDDTSPMNENSTDSVIGLLSTAAK